MARPLRASSSARSKTTLDQVQSAVGKVASDQRSGMLGNLLAFCRVLRDLGLDVTAGRILDICRSLEYVDICDQSQFYHTLRSNLVSSYEDMEVFDQVFSLFWRLPQEEERDQDLGAGGAGEEEGDQQGGMPLRQFLVEASRQEGEKEAPEPMPTPAYSAEEVFLTKDFSAYTADEVPVIRDVISQVASRLSIRMSRRRKSDARGKEVDLRRTFRRNLKYGGEVVELARRRKRIKKTRLVLLCDVSGSMDCYSKFVAQFIFGLQNELTNVETFVFSTSLTRVSHLLERRSLDEALAQVAKHVHDWSGGTNIGASFQAFNEGQGRGLFSGRTILMVVSDGWDRGDPQVLEGEMKKFRKRAYRTLWLNPLLGSPSYLPLCEGMKTALPYVDLFLPLHDLESLVALGETLESLTR